MKKRYASLGSLFSLLSTLLLGLLSTGQAAPLIAGPVCTSFTNKNSADGLPFDQITSVAASGQSVYAGTSKGLGISRDGGNSFTSKGVGSVTNIYTNGMMVYLATNGEGLLISTDAGQNFISKTVADGLGNIFLRDVYVDGTNVYVACSKFLGVGGLSISTDGGKKFINKTTADNLASNEVTEVYATGNIIYAATDEGLSISKDGGNTFTNKSIADGLGTPLNPTVYSVYAIGNTVYVATINGLAISTDGGNTFTNKASADGLGSAVISVYALGQTVYAGLVDGLGISTDGGNHFTTYTGANGLGKSRIDDVYVTDNQIYAATERGLSFCQAAALPVELVSFSAQPLPSNKVLLTWQTVREIDNAYFQIERSLDLTQSEKLGKVAANESTGWQGNTYTYTDEQPYQGTSYYRLRQIDLNGHSRVYPWVAVVLDEQAYGIYPNPVMKGRFNVHLDEPLTAILSLYTVTGESLALERVGLEGRNVVLQIREILTSGEYVLRVEERAQIRTHRLIVK